MPEHRALDWRPRTGRHCRNNTGKNICSPTWPIPSASAAVPEISRQTDAVSGYPLRRPRGVAQRHRAENCCRHISPGADVRVYMINTISMPPSWHAATCTRLTRRCTLAPGGRAMCSRKLMTLTVLLYLMNSPQRAAVTGTMRLRRDTRRIPTRLRQGARNVNTV